MKKNTRKISIGFCMMVFVVCSNCKSHKTDSSPGPDPCYGKVVTGAMFNISENVNASGNDYPFWINYSTDTITQNTYVVKFDALDTAALNYQWTIGSDVYTTKSITVNFFTRPAAQKIFPITLKVMKQHTNACFPSDTGSMTFTKLMVISDTSIVSGYFNGYRTDTLGKNASDTFTVYLNPLTPVTLYDGSNQPYADTTLVIKNLYPNCATSQKYSKLEIGYKELYFYDPPNETNCNNIEGRALLTPSNNDIIIYYSIVNPETSLFEYYIFKGKRKS